MSSRKSKSQKQTPTPHVIHTCGICGAAFYEESKFKEHMKFHQDSNDQMETSQPSISYPYLGSNIPNMDIGNPTMDISSPNMDSVYPYKESASPNMDSNNPNRKLILCQHPICNTLCVDQESYEKHLLTHGNFASHNTSDVSNSQISQPNMDIVNMGVSVESKTSRKVTSRKRKHNDEQRVLGSGNEQRRTGGIAIGSVIQNKVADRKRQRIEGASKESMDTLSSSSSDTLHQVICPHCNIEMFAPMTLCMAHIRSHSRPSINPVVCIYKNNLLSAHSKKKTLTFACTDCSATFTSYEKLTSHAKTHVRLKDASKVMNTDAGVESGPTTHLTSTGLNPEVRGQGVSGSIISQIQQSVSSRFDTVNSTPQSSSELQSTIFTGLQRMPPLQSSTVLHTGLQNSIGSQSSSTLENSTGSQSSTGLQNSTDLPSSAGLQNSTGSQSSTGLQNSTDSHASARLQNSTDSHASVRLQNSTGPQSSTSVPNSVVSNLPIVEEDLDAITEIKQERPSPEPSPKKAKILEQPTREIHMQKIPSSKVYTCHDMSCTFRSFSAWLYQVHIDSIHPFPAFKPPTSSQPVVLNVPDVSTRTSEAIRGTSTKSAESSSPAAESPACVEEKSQKSLSTSGGAEPSGSTLFRCNVCNCGYSNYDTFYKSHMTRTEEPGPGWQAGRKGASPTVLLSCTHCEQRFPAYYLYMNHMQSHMIKSDQSSSLGAEISYEAHTSSPSALDITQVTEPVAGGKPYNPLRCSICKKRCFTMTDYHKHERLCLKELRNNERKEKKRMGKSKSAMSVEEKDVIPLQPVMCDNKLQFTSLAAPAKQYCKPCITAFNNEDLYYKHMASEGHAKLSCRYFRQRLHELQKFVDITAPNKVPLFKERQTCVPCEATFDKIHEYYQHMGREPHAEVCFQYYTSKLKGSGSQSLQRSSQSLQQSSQSLQQSSQSLQQPSQSLLQSTPFTPISQCVVSSDAIKPMDTPKQSSMINKAVENRPVSSESSQPLAQKNRSS